MSASPVPPAKIPADLHDEFTLNGKIPVGNWYFDNRQQGPPLHITAEAYAEVFFLLEKRLFDYYGRVVNQFHDAFLDYDFRDKKVIIWGLEGCNCEAMALWQGAEKVYVVDYNTPQCDHKKITVLTHEELREHPAAFDYAISFSSFEHDGLGRYGDPLSPRADIAAMQLAGMTLKDDGVLFLGVPLGRDAVIWNAHRIYGATRLPLLLNGWLPWDVYSVYCGGNVFAEPFGAFEAQPLLALKKFPPRTEPTKALVEAIRHAREVMKMPHPGTRDGRMLLQILEILLHHKE